MGSISGIASSLLQQTVFQSSGLSGTSSTEKTGANPRNDNNQLSPLAKVLGELQTLQQTDPAKYKDLTGQIAVKLQAAADADTASGDLTGASKLSQLATDFTAASKTGQLPNLQDVAKTLGGGHHHHHHGHGGGAESSESQVQTAYQSTLNTPSTSSDPTSIVLTALSS